MRRPIPNDANFISSVYNLYRMESARFGAHHSVTNYRGSELERNYSFAWQMKQFCPPSPPLCFLLLEPFRSDIICAGSSNGFGRIVCLTVTDLGELEIARHHY